MNAFMSLIILVKSFSATSLLSHYEAMRAHIPVPTARAIATGAAITAPPNITMPSTTKALATNPAAIPPNVPTIPPATKSVSLILILLIALRLSNSLF